MPEPEQARTFLDALFADCPPSQRFLVWTLPDKLSRWYTSDTIDNAATDIAAMPDKDVYVGVGLTDRDRGQKRRATPEQVTSIVGMWADIDILDDAHKKANLPPDVLAARAIVDSIGIPASIIVHSGHGLQAWWLLAEPWSFTDPDDRNDAATLANRWNLTLRIRAAEKGYTVDSTFDLSRVMRLPGTVNRKNKDALVDVQLLEVNEHRYNPEDLEQQCADDTALAMLAGRRTHAVGHLQLNPAAVPDHDKLDALLSNDQRFAQSWNRTRKDLDDQSGSSYDLALANTAAAVGWTDQEIVDLLIASRRKHHDDLKMRLDYYQRTIAKARDDSAREHASNEITTTTQMVEQAEVLGDRNTVNRGKRQLTDEVSNMLGVEWTRFIRYTQDPPRYRGETTSDAVTFGTADVILSQNKMRAAIASVTKIVIPRFKGPKWDDIAQAIFTACDDEDTGIESTDEGMAFSWLTEYLTDRPVTENVEEAAATQNPYRVNGNVFVFGPALRRWIHLTRGDRVSPQRMGEVLRAYGCDHTTPNVMINGERTTRSVWQLPDEHDYRVEGEMGDDDAF